MFDTSNPLVYEVSFSTTFDNFNQYIQTYSIITIPSFSPTDFNYTLSFDTTNQNFYINIITLKAFVNGPLLTYNFNINDFFLLQNNFIMPTKSASIQLTEYYPISESAAKTAAALISQAATIQSVTSGIGYSTAMFSSGSGVLAQGLMLQEMIFLLKFVNINYPPIVKQMFDSKNTSPTLIFYFTFVDDSRDSVVVPSLFQYYHVSVYFLNNIGEAICEMFAIMAVAILLLNVTPYNKEEEKVKPSVVKKILIFLKYALVWETTLFYVFMNLQKLIFYIACSWMFPPINSANALVNFCFANVSGFISIFWLLHLIEKIRVCQQFKLDKIKGTPLKNGGIMEKSISSTVKTNKSQIFPSDSPSLLMSPNIKDKDFPMQASTPPKTFHKDNKENTDGKIYGRTFGTLHFADHEEDQSSLEISSTSKASNILIQNSETSIHEKFIDKIKRCFGAFSLKNIKKFLFEPKDPRVYLRRYEILHVEYKFEGSMHKYYAFLYYARQGLLSIMAVMLYQYPLIQIITLNVLNISFVFYTIFARPFTTIYSLVVCSINELITETAMFSALIIGIFDHIGNDDYQQRMLLGWIIIFANLILLYWVMATGIFRPIAFGIYHAWQKRNNLNKIHNLSKN